MPKTSFLLFLVLCSICIGSSVQELKLTTSKSALTKDANSLDLICTSDTVLQKVTFFENDKSLYELSDGKDKEVKYTVKDKNTKMDNVYCKTDSESSEKINIPYIGEVKLTHQPDGFEVNSNYTMNCTVDVQYTGDAFQYKVNYLFNDQSIIEFTYTPSKNSSTPSAVAKVTEDLVAVFDNTQTQIYLMPLKDTSNKDYTCKITVGDTVQASEKYDLNGTNTVLPSIITLFALITIGKYFC